jgi:deoxycytidine triphosphate deaminase
MFISPLHAIQKGWITHSQCKTVDDWKQRKFISPNAIDFTLDKLGIINSKVGAIIGESSKTMRPVDPYEPTSREWLLDGNSVYDGMSDMYVEVPEGVAAVLWTRSTFARNGVFIMSGLYDTGFKGNIGFTIYTIGGPIKIEQGTRIGQIGFIAAANAGAYAGGYNHEAGKHWTAAKDRNKSSLAPKPAQSSNFLIDQPTEQPQVDSQVDPQVDPLVGGSAQSTLAKELQTTSTWNSDQQGPPAGTKSFF